MKKKKLIRLYIRVPSELKKKLKKAAKQGKMSLNEYITAILD